MGTREIYRMVLAILLGFCGCANAQDPERASKVVIIDAGHGGTDSGAVSQNGLMEKEVVLDIAYWMLYWNKELFDNGLDIFLTRDKDTLISLSDRTKVAKALRPDLFLSLHCNHSGNPRAKGVEAYMYPVRSGYRDSSEIVARNLVRALNNKLGFDSRGVKERNFQVLRENRNVCRAVLLELGFLSREEESGYLGLRSKRSALALAIVETIYRYFGPLDEGTK